MWLMLGHIIDVNDRLTSKQMETLLGHWCFMALVRRPALSVARSCYDFAQRGFGAPERIWPSVRKELEIMRGVMCLLQTRLDAPLHPLTTAFDACGSGHGSVDGCMQKAAQKEAASWQERWRYRSADDSISRNPRERALGAMRENLRQPSDTSDPDSNDKFPEVNIAAIQQTSWKRAHFSPHP